MYAIILRHNATVGTTPHGVVVVHETNAPVLVGTTPLSQLLLSKYANGFKTVVYDRAFNRKRDVVVPPSDLAVFFSVGTTYFSNANMSLEKIPYTLDHRSIVIDGNTYNLKEL
jgi:hypothetical protein